MALRGAAARGAAGAFAVWATGTVIRAGEASGGRTAPEPALPVCLGGPWLQAISETERRPRRRRRRNSGPGVTGKRPGPARALSVRKHRGAFRAQMGGRKVRCGRRAREDGLPGDSGPLFQLSVFRLCRQYKNPEMNPLRDSRSPQGAPQGGKRGRIRHFFVESVQRGKSKNVQPKTLAPQGITEISPENVRSLFCTLFCIALPVLWWYYTWALLPGGARREKLGS